MYFGDIDHSVEPNHRPILIQSVDPPGMVELITFHRNVAGQGVAGIAAEFVAPALRITIQVVSGLGEVLLVQ